MLSYACVRGNRRELLALTGLTAREFRLLLGTFSRAYERRHPAGRTGAGLPRRRAEGGGRKAVLGRAEDKLLFILTYLKTYPLQAVMARLFGLSQPSVNQWIHRLLPVLREALAGLGAVPERDPARFARSGRSDRRPAGARRADPRLVIDGTDRRRQRPKTPREQAVHYSGKRKAHCDRNVVVTGPRRGRVRYLSGTYPCRAHDKAIADHEGIRYPPGTVLYKDGGFQGYEPAVAETRQAEKKAARPRTHARAAARQPEAGAGAGRGGARHRRRQAVPHREGRPAQHQARPLRRRHGGSFRTAQPAGAQPQAAAPEVARHG
jgi:hypothetical protein